ncbi:MAG: hypothetical protein HC858_06345 [Brachymonas sp.]|nr:hypothetical protein [Brachymonas sp.]
MELAADAYDQMAARTAIAVIRKSSAGVSALALQPGLKSKYYADQQGFFSNDKASLPPDVIATLKGAKVTHLVLLTKRSISARCTARAMTRNRKAKWIPRASLEVALEVVLQGATFSIQPMNLRRS